MHYPNYFYYPLHTGTSSSLLGSLNNWQTSANMLFLFVTAAGSDTPAP